MGSEQCQEILKQLEHVYENNLNGSVYHEWGKKTTYQYCVKEMIQTNLLSGRVRRIMRQSPFEKESSRSLVHHFFSSPDLLLSACDLSQPSCLSSV